MTRLLVVFWLIQVRVNKPHREADVSRWGSSRQPTVTITNVLWFTSLLIKLQLFAAFFFLQFDYAIIGSCEKCLKAIKEKNRNICGKNEILNKKMKMSLLCGITGQYDNDSKNILSAKNSKLKKYIGKIVGMWKNCKKKKKCGGDVKMV